MASLFWLEILTNISIEKKLRVLSGLTIAGHLALLTLEVRNNGLVYAFYCKENFKKLLNTVTTYTTGIRLCIVTEEP